MNAPQPRTTPYVAVVLRNTKRDFSIHFPDLPGCVTAGTTMQEARRHAAEALTSHLHGIVAAGRPLPLARSLGDIRDDPECGLATTLILVEARAKSDEKSR